MNILEIKKYPDEVLRRKSLPVETVGDREKEIFSDMLKAMSYFKGIGLAAPQIGISEQLIVADIGEGTVFLANPRIVKEKGREVLEEGCLSIPDAEVKIERSYEVVVIGLSDKGKLEEIRACGLMARVLQHEIDHLQGELIIDYLPLLELACFKRDYKYY